MRVLTVAVQQLPKDLDWVVVGEAGRETVAFVREDAGPGDLAQVAEAVVLLDAERLAG